MREALALLEEAIRNDPQYAPALGFAALCCHLRAQTPPPRIERRSGRRE
jgi:hypothetical protein